MADTTMTLSEGQRARLAPPSAHGGAASSWTFQDSIAGAGALRTTAHDLMLFARANLAEDGPLRETLALARRPLHELPDGQQVACAWHVARDRTTLWHNGMTGGYAAYLALNEPLGVAVVVLGNGTAGEVTVVGERLIQLLAGGSPEPLALQKPATLEPERLEALVGKYASPIGLTLVVTREGKGLFARVVGQTALRVDPVAPGRFKYRVVEAELEFDEAGAGRASAVTLHQNGRVIRCERVEG